MSLLDQAHQLIRDRLHPEAIAIDATVGNGHDTRFLLDCVAPSGSVYGFDIQEAALAATRQRLQNHPGFSCLHLICESHDKMWSCLPLGIHGKVAAVMFNLGYLPGGDKSIITLANSTLTALSESSRLLAVGGIITVLAYPGHDGGDLETTRVSDWCDRLDRQEFQVEIFEYAAKKPSSPRLFSVVKIA